MICSITVTHEADPDAVSAQLRQLARQVDRMFVIDNGSANAAAIAEVAAEHGAHLRLLQANAGIAAAHNLGFALAREAGCSRALLMDDDSQPADDMVAHLDRALDAATVPVVAAAPQVVDERSGRPAPLVTRVRARLRVTAHGPYGTTPSQVLPVALAIASGLLVDLRVAQQVGDMRDGYFIDHVDTEWCLRAGAMGFAILAVTDARLVHRLGGGSHRVWLGRWRYVPVHGPLRSYYQWRNLLLMSQHLKLAGSDRRFFALRLGAATLLQMLSGPQRLRRVRLALRGIWHGSHGVDGMLDTRTGQCVPVPAPLSVLGAALAAGQVTRP